jgi:hypothetical protein
MIQGDQSKKIHWADFLLLTINHFAKEYQKAFMMLRTEQMSGICLFIFIQEDHIKNVCNVYASSKKVDTSF